MVHLLRLGTTESLNHVVSVSTAAATAAVAAHSHSCDKKYRMGAAAAAAAAAAGVLYFREPRVTLDPPLYLHGLLTVSVVDAIGNAFARLPFCISQALKIIYCAELNY